MMTTKQERILLLLLATAQFTNIMDFMIMMPLGPQLMRMFSISPQEFSFLVSAYTFSAGVSGFCIAFFADRFDRKRLLTWVYTGFTVGTLACGLAPNYTFLLLARLITGIFGGVVSSIVLTIVSDVIPMKRRGAAMGIINTAFSAASVFGVPFGLMIANLWGWHSPFLFLVCVAIPIQFLIRKYVPKVDHHLKNERVKPYDVMRNIWSNGNQVRALGFICVMMFSHFILIPFLSPSMVANVGFTEGQLTWIYFIGGAVSIVTGPWIGRLADRIGKQKVFTLAAICSFLPVLWITHMGPTILPFALVATTLFFVFSGGRMIPAFATVSGTVTPKNRGSFMSILACLQQVSAGIASFVAGFIVVRQESTGALLRYPILGYISVVTGLICLYLIRKIEVIEQDTQQGMLHE